MDEERGYLAQALLEGLSAAGFEHRVLGSFRNLLDTEIQLSVRRAGLGRVPRQVARFCHEYDLQLVQLLQPEIDAWLCVLAFSDEVGRPRFLRVRIIGNWYRGTRRLLDDAHLLAATPVEIRRARRRPPGPRIDAALRLCALRARQALEGAGATIAFIGGDPALREALVLAVERDLGPAFPAGVPGRLRLVQHGADKDYWGIDVRIVLGEPAYARRFPDALALDASVSLAAAVTQVQRAILRWLEIRVERRYPSVVVGANPLAARLLQKKIPFLHDLLALMLHCSIDCRIRTPILMPYPFGIVIERDARIGSRVSVMQHVMIAQTESGAPVIEDNVRIGPGAKIIGGVRIGRGAVVGANAVVTRDVPSHCTVVGANRILGQGESAFVGDERRSNAASVVNM